MDQSKLQRLLHELHTELGSAESLDPESRALVVKVLEDLGAVPEAAPAERHATAASGLREAMLRFETEHPRLAATVGQVADALAKLGI